MHLVGYLYVDYHDARSLEHKKSDSAVVIWSVYLLKYILIFWMALICSGTVSLNEYFLLEPWFTSVDGLSTLQAGEDNAIVNLLE